MEGGSERIVEVRLPPLAVVFRQGLRPLVALDEQGKERPDPRHGVEPVAPAERAEEPPVRVVVGEGEEAAEDLFVRLGGKEEVGQRIAEVGVGPALGRT